MRKNAKKKFECGDFLSVMERIKSEFKLKNDKELLQLLEIPQSTFSRKKKKNFPTDWAYLLAKRYGLLTEWIMTGQGPKRLAEAKHSEQTKAGFLREFELWAQEITGGGNLDWLENQLESQFPAWKKWREEK